MYPATVLVFDGGLLCIFGVRVNLLPDLIAISNTSKLLKILGVAATPSKEPGRFCFS